MSGDHPNPIHPIPVQRALICAATLTWVSTVVVLPVAVSTPALRRGVLLALEVLLCAVAVATTLAATVRSAVATKAAYFEQGYIAGLLDSREPEPPALSMSSIKRPEIPSQEDHRNSNKLV